MSQLLLIIFTFVALNCENLFDTVHDEGKDDHEFLPTSSKQWTSHRYWQKLTHISQAIVSCAETDTMACLPDMAILTEVENDSVMRDLTRRSPLRAMRYDYVMTSSADKRGIDIALLYSPMSFNLLCHHAVRVAPPEGHSPTRDILYACGTIAGGDTLHVIGVHAPSRAGGKKRSEAYRLLVASALCAVVDSVSRLHADPLIVVAGDFNDYSNDAALQMLAAHGLTEISAGAKGSHGAEGTYRYQGRWGSLDHILCSSRLASMAKICRICDQPFLMEKDKRYGGMRPHRTFSGIQYLGGYSDHLPLVANFLIPDS